MSWAVFAGLDQNDHVVKYSEKRKLDAKQCGLIDLALSIVKVFALIILNTGLQYGDLRICWYNSL